MKKADAVRRARNPRFISGIYNYCDRWCERCEMTARCANYDPADDRRRNPGAGDMERAEFWDKLGETLAATLEMARDMAAEQGISLDEADLAEYEREEKRQRETAEAHPLACAADRYADSVDAWFKEHEALFRDKERELQSAHAMGLPGPRPEAEAASIGDCLEVIRWHQYQIHIKLMRALQHEPLDDDDPDEPSDADGSAKVALIGADRSLAAWGRLREHVPEATDTIVDLLAALDRIRRLAERAFPKARAFVRPGFDTPKEAKPARPQP